ncbi:MAG: NYN domain-containing protein [Egibacteraceae bacterium]
MENARAGGNRRARLFIDFWNFQLNWNDRMGQAVGCDWKALPNRILARTTDLISAAGWSGALELEETLLYASVDPQTESKLRGWLESFVGRLPSYNVKIRERRARAKNVHCRNCGKDLAACPDCAQPFVQKLEKGVDAAIVTDLLSLAWQGGYDVAVLVSGDADFIPAVEHVQAKGLKVVNASWSRHGFELKKTCWASFDLDEIAQDVVREQDH